jgi:ankyrin repeat protein
LFEICERKEYDSDASIVKSFFNDDNADGIGASVSNDDDKDNSGTHISDSSATRETVDIPFLHLAVIEEQLRIVEYLVANGATMESKDSNGLIPLHHAIINNRSEIVKYLVENHANIETEDNNGRTLVHVAIIYNHLGMVIIWEW